MVTTARRRQHRSAPGQIELFGEPEADPADRAEAEAAIEPVEDPERDRPATRKERMAWFRNARFPGLSERRSQNLQKMCEVLEVCSGRYGCKPRREVIAAKMRCSANTVDRTRQDGEAVGVIRTVPRYDGGGQQSNEWVIVWPRLKALQPERPAPHFGEAPPQNGEAAPQSGEAPPRSGEALYIDPCPSPTDSSRSKSGALGERVGDVGDGRSAGVIWGRRVAVEELSDPAKVTELWGTYIGQGVYDSDLATPAEFFALVHLAATGDNPVGLLTHLLRGERDQFGKTWRQKLRPADKHWAACQIRKGYGRGPQIRSALEAAVRRSPHARARIASTQALNAILNPPARTPQEHVAALKAAVERGELGGDRCEVNG